jgi:hypothetical protein
MAESICQLMKRMKAGKASATRMWLTPSQTVPRDRVEIFDGRRDDISWFY